MDRDSQEVISPIALGLISDPPTIVLAYDFHSSSGNENSRFGEKKWKRRKRKMPLRDFTDRSNVKRYAFNLRQRHVKYLTNVTDVTLEKMMRVIQEIQKGNDVESSLGIVNKEYSIDPEEDLNKLSPAQLAQRKAVMDETFRENLVRPGDPEYVYDKEIAFEEVKKVEGNDWDEEEEEEGEDRDRDDGEKMQEENKKDVELKSPEPDKSETEEEKVLSFPLIPMKDKDLDREEENKASPEQELVLAEKLAPAESAKKQEDPPPQSPEPKENVSLPERKDPEPESDDSTSNIEVALDNLEIETGGALDEEDEDFWT